VFFNQGLWWDEAVYLGLGVNILKGSYSLDPGFALETFRPPLFPLVISILSKSIILTRVLVVIISIIGVIVTYYLAKSLFNKKIALWSCLFLSTNQLFILFTTKTLSESLFIMFLSLSLLLFLKRNRHLSVIMAGIFVGLAFLTRYLGTLLIASYVIYFIYVLAKKETKRNTLFEMLSFLIGFFIILLPWFYVGYLYYGSPIGHYLENLRVYSQASVSNPMDTFLYFFQSWRLQIIFIFTGIVFFIRYFGRHRNRDLVLLPLFFLPIIYFIFILHKEPRYLLSFLPIYAILAALGTDRLSLKSSKVIPLIAIIICLSSMLIGFHSVWNDRFAANALIQGSLYLKNITDPKESILSESYPYIYYLSERKSIRFPDTFERIIDIIRENKIRFILVYKFEEGNPEYVYEFFPSKPEFKKIRNFEQWGEPEAVIIYEFSD
jgi:4-amino-4-deoxy-L-arabinose transferase-like glycosyltransferase